MEQVNKSSGKLISVQFLRAVAAFTVVIGHAQTEAMQVNPAFSPIKFDFGIGVDIFFVISGFIMIITSQSLYEKKSGPLIFIKKRFIRIVPLYWFYTTAMIIAIFMFPSQLQSAKFDWANFFASYLFIPHDIGGGRYYPILALGWTLNYEIFFYAVFSFTLLLDKNKGFIALLILMTALVILGILIPQLSPPLHYWTNSIILEFIGGAICGYVYLRLGTFRSAPLLVITVILSGVVYAYLDRPSAYRVVSNGIPALLFFIAFLFFTPLKFEKKIEPISSLMGDPSYSLYLSHPFVLAIVKFVWFRFYTGPEIFWAYVVVSSVLSIIVAYLSYRLLEVRIIHTNLVNNIRTFPRPMQRR